MGTFNWSNENLERLRERWRSRHHVGAAKPWMRAWVRTGKVQRGYEHVHDRDVFARVPGVLGANQIWAGRWQPLHHYKELRHVFTATGSQNFEQNGVQTMTLVIDNIAVDDVTGPNGEYHELLRGYFSPYYGYKPPNRIRIGQKNSWFDLLNDQSTELVLCAGLGNRGVPIFKGTVDKVGMTSRPDRMTLVARDMGKYLTDQYCFLNAKIRALDDPITFSDRRDPNPGIGGDKSKLKWILVDDAADVVKTVFQWCGLHDWEVESTNVRLKRPKTFNRGDKLIDIVKWIGDLTSYVYYMKPPSVFDPDDLSQDNEVNLTMGTPVFRHNQALKGSQQLFEPLEMVADHNLLQEIEPEIDGSKLPWNIRVRGAPRPRKKRGRSLGGEKTTRYMYVYRPPWSRKPNFPDGTGKGDYENGNLKGYEVYHKDSFTSFLDCKVAAIQIAVQAALEANKGTASFPWFPTMLLDQMVSLKDLGTGLSTRLYISDRTYELQTGESLSFKVSLGGALVDAPDVIAVRGDLIAVEKEAGINPGLSQDQRDWLHRHPGQMLAV